MTEITTVEKRDRIDTHDGLLWKVNDIDEDCVYVERVSGKSAMNKYQIWGKDAVRRDLVNGDISVINHD